MNNTVVSHIHVPTHSVKNRASAQIKSRALLNHNLNLITIWVCPSLGNMLLEYLKRLSRVALSLENLR